MPLASPERKAEPMASRKERCGWPNPAPNQATTGAVICRSCHGVLIFDLHTYQWKHEATR